MLAMMKKLLFATIILIFMGMPAFTQVSSWLFVGTYTGSGSNGIYVYRFNNITGQIDSVSSASIENPSYLTLSPNGKFLYCVTENGGDRPGEVSAFSFNDKSGKLTFLNKQVTGGDHPCHLSVDAENKWVAVANYSGGSLAMFGINSDGSLQKAAQIIHHEGHSVLKSRQLSPHVHSVTFSPGENYLLAADLGTDQIIAYPFTKSNPQPLDTAQKITISTKAGNGPRHIAFNESKSIFYAIDELTGTLSAYHFAEKNTTLLQTAELDTISPLPDRGSADVHLSPDGKFLYATNRGLANNIGIYSIDGPTGKLSLLGFQPSGGEKPRNFTIDMLGGFLLAANQQSDNITVFARDKVTGLLTKTDKQITVKSPVCLKLLLAN